MPVSEPHRMGFHESVRPFVKKSIRGCLKSLIAIPGDSGRPQMESQAGRVSYVLPSRIPSRPDVLWASPAGTKSGVDGNGHQERLAGGGFV